MSSPVDIKAVMDAMGDAEAARNQQVEVHVYVDDTAPRDLVNIALAATRSTSGNASVINDAYPPENAIPDAVADMAILVAGESAGTGRLYRSLQTVGVPTVVMAADEGAVLAIAAEEGHAIATGDVVAPDSRKNARALSDRAVDSPILLDSSDAQEMLAKLGSWIVEVFKEKRLAFAYAFPYVRKPLALESVNATAVQNAGIGVVAIIPGADLPLMTLNQVKMLLEMAAAYGEELSLGRVKEIAAIVGGALACRGIARQVVGVVPGAGWLVKGGIGYTGTMAMGRALVEYFEQGTDVGATAASAAENVKGFPAWAGVSRDKGLAENIQLATSAVGEKVSEAASGAARNFVPAVTGLAEAAVGATGFTKDDVASFASGAVDTLKGKLRK